MSLAVKLLALLHLFGTFLAYAQFEAPEAPRRREHREERRVRMHDRHSLGQTIVVRTNETVGDLVLFGGSLDVQGTVDGDVVMIGGDVKISGEVSRGVVLIGGALESTGTIGRDSVVVLGGANLGDKAKIEGSGVFIGGPFNIATGAEILGEKLTIPLGDVLKNVEWFKTWLVRGPLLGRLLPVGVTWAWAVAGTMLFLYLLTLILFPSAVKGTYLALEKQPIASLISGLLALILLAPLVVLLAITIVGIIAIPFVKLALILALIVGKAAVICFIGRSVGRSAGATFLQAPFLSFVIGAILLTVLYMVPVLGLAAWGIGTILGLGAALVAMGNSFSKEESENRPLAVPLSTIQTETAPTGIAAPAFASQTSEIVPAPPLQAPIAPPDTMLLRRAGFWRRLLAALLDLILVALLIPLVGPFFFFIGIAYFVAMWTWKGTTIGSILLGLKIIRTDGRPINFAVALVRSLSSIFSGLVLFLGFLWAAWDREKQTWHDKIAGTVVVRMPKDFALI